jgi:hypothetical protein
VRAVTSSSLDAVDSEVMARKRPLGSFRIWRLADIRGVQRLSAK